eukprot:2570643-Ditylum_brightwellii.AAC.1
MIHAPCFWNGQQSVQVCYGLHGTPYPATIVERRLHVSTNMWWYLVKWEWNHGEIYPDEWVANTEIVVGGHGCHNGTPTEHYDPANYE